MTGTIKGTISNDEGDAIQDTTVTVADAVTKEVEAIGTTNEAGKYSVSVTPDTYDVRSEKIGFEADEKRVTIGTDVRKTVDLTLVRLSADVVGEISDGPGVGVLGTVTDNSEASIGVQGEVSSDLGYGLYTPNDARIDGTIGSVKEWMVIVDDKLGFRLAASKEFETVLRGQAKNSTASGSVVMGHLNKVSSGIGGAVICGGGLYDRDDDRRLDNRVTDHFGTIGGGFDNLAGNDDDDPGAAVGATVSGGTSNIASGVRSTVGGGTGNEATEEFATIGGGGGESGDDGNTASGSAATVAGGEANAASGDHATVGGGNNNEADGESATIGGGDGNAASSTRGATVGGGFENEASSSDATIGGGIRNKATLSATTIGGGRENKATGANATISGGWRNGALLPNATVGGGNSNEADAENATVSGGHSNEVSGAASTVGGGRHNTVSGKYATVGGGGDEQSGRGNKATGDYATIAGGGINKATANNATVGGGGGHTAGGRNATVGGGASNEATGQGATVPGGSSNIADGNYSFAAGQFAHAEHNGTFVFADSSRNRISSNSNNEARFQMPVYAPNFNNTSARSAKTNIESIDSTTVLKGVKDLEISTWESKHNGSGRHMGTMAEDFADTFGLGDTDESISTVDADGVAFAAIQGLAKKLDEKDERIADLEERLSALESQVGSDD